MESEFTIIIFIILGAIQAVDGQRARNLMGHLDLFAKSQEMT